jgi:hypothetical protein
MCNPSEMQPWSFTSRKMKKQVVERIVEGITRIYRACFVFQAAPASFYSWKNWRWWIEILLTPISRELRSLQW